MISFAIRIGLFCLLFAASVADAQTDGNVLRGIKDARIVIDNLSDSTKKCNITESDIKSSIMFPISSSNIIISNNSRVTIFLSINAINSSNGIFCAANIYMQMFVYQLTKINETGRESYVMINLWDKTGVYFGNKDGFSEHIGDTIDNYTKKLITDWNLDNK